MNWRDVIGYEGYYQVSDTGMVRSVARVAVRSNGRKHNIKSKMLAPALDKHGYLNCALCVDGKISSFKVHKLVANAFLGVEKGKEVNHKDGNKTNNNLFNLELITHRENVIHSFKNGLQVPLKGSQVHNSKLNEVEIPIIRKLLNNGVSCRAMGRLFGMDKSVFQDIKNNLIWRHA